MGILDATSVEFYQRNMTIFFYFGLFFKQTVQRDIEIINPNITISRQLSINIWT